MTTPLLMHRNWALHLKKEASLPRHALPVFDGTLASAKQGVAYFLTESKRPLDSSRWFAGVLAGVERRETPESAARLRVNLYIHPAFLLNQASFSAGGSMRPHAHRLLRMYAPLVADHDCVLSELLQVFEKRMGKDPAQVDKGWVGDVTDEERAQFDRHLRKLRGTRAFMRPLIQNMRDTFQPVRIPRLEKTLPRCSAHRRRAKDCETCAKVWWVRDGFILSTSLLDKHETNKFIRQAPMPPVVYGEFKNAWANELRYWLSADREDGVAHLIDESTGNPRGIVLVNLAEVIRQAVATGRPSPLLEHADPAYPEDHLRTAVRARQAYESHTRGKLDATSALRRQSVFAEALEVGWENTTPDRELNPFLALWTRRAVTRLVRGKEGRVALARYYRRNRRPGAKPRRSRLVVLDCSLAVGGAVNEYRVQVARKRLPRGTEHTYYFEVPYPVPLQELNVRQDRKITVEGKDLWSLRAINSHANGSDMPVMVAFRDWVIKALITLPTDYQRVRYNHTRGDRLNELNEGTRKHLGPFSLDEDRILHEEFGNREPRTLIPEEEWVTILARLPGRSVGGIRRRVEGLGKELARREGYQTFYGSGYCLRASHARKKKWAREGIR